MLSQLLRVTDIGTEANQQEELTVENIEPINTKSLFSNSYHASNYLIKYNYCINHCQNVNYHVGTMYLSIFLSIKYHVGKVNLF